MIKAKKRTKWNLPENNIKYVNFVTTALKEHMKNVEVLYNTIEVIQEI